MLAAAVTPVSVACTAMVLGDAAERLIARNHDWPFGEAIIVVNRRGIQKHGLTLHRPARWVSKHGSVSLVQFGRELPFAGMNERGLTVDLLHLPDAEFPKSTDNPAVNTIQWVQYQLDTACTVDEVVSSLEDVTPMPMLAQVERVHYLINDAEGDSAIVEFLDGQTRVHRGASIGYCVLANRPWEASIAASQTPQAESPQDWRFETALATVGRSRRDASPSNGEASTAIADPPVSAMDLGLDTAFEALASVAQPATTQWNVVYQPAQRRFWIRTRVAAERKLIDLYKIDFSPSLETEMLDIDASVSGDVTEHWQRYDPAANQALVENAFSRFLSGSPMALPVQHLVLGYPATLSLASEPEKEAAE